MRLHRHLFRPFRIIGDRNTYYRCRCGEPGYAVR